MWESNQSGNVPIVQGVAVNNNAPYANNTMNNSAHIDYGDGFSGSKGQPQPKQFNDVFFAALFYAHLGIMAVLLAMTVGGQNGGGGGYGGLVFLCIACGIFAIGLSTVALGFMMQFATQLVKMALFFSIGCSLAMGVLGLLTGQFIMGIFGLLSFAIGCCYAYVVWNRIPFAAANLNTALTAVRANLGLAVVAYVFLALAMVWSIWWSVATADMMNAYGSGVVFLFLVSYYWTHQVLQNTMHVTSAGVIGTWWFAPDEASSCCSQAIGDSFTRATTYSFGSICFGSLIVAVVQALRTLNHYLRDNEEFQLIVCCIDCILGCIESILEYLNKWAYVYVGLYGYSYLDAGKNVMTLFQNKGWTTIITDDLAENVLFMISIGIGLITGFVGLIISELDQNIFANMDVDSPGNAGFLVGFIVGVVMSSILMSVVGSAVNTVIVCFAESPREFEVNHTQLSMDMRNAWRQAWPDECRGI